MKHPGKTVAKTTILAFLAVAIGLSVAVLQLHDQGNGESAYASSGGRVGRSTAPGCNACHGGGAAPTVTLSGPATVASGSTSTYTLTISGGAGVVGGLDVSVNGGTLASTDPSTKLQTGEITQTAPKTFVSGNAVFSFNWTAPAGPANVTMNAAGLSADDDGSDAGDMAAFASLAVSVQTPATPTPSPTPPPTPTPSPTPTQAPTATPSPTPTAPPTATPSPTPTAPPIATPSPTPTASPIATPSPTPTAPPTATPSPTPTAPPTATPTSVPSTSTPAPTPTSTRTPTPTPTISPTPTATGHCDGPDGDDDGHQRRGDRDDHRHRRCRPERTPRCDGGRMSFDRAGAACRDDDDDREGRDGRARNHTDD